jgi:hypothetical protein
MHEMAVQSPAESVKTDAIIRAEKIEKYSPAKTGFRSSPPPT